MLLPNPIIIHKIDSSHPLFAQVFALREKVLRKPLGLSLYNEDTSADALDIIFVALNEGQVIACVMIKTIDQFIAKPRQMAVAAEWQKRGVGQLLMQEAENYMRSLGCQELQLHARQYAIGFYQKLGYEAYGPEFEEVGIAHRAMRKTL